MNVIPLSSDSDNQKVNTSNKTDVAEHKIMELESMLTDAIINSTSKSDLSALSREITIARNKELSLIVKSGKTADNNSTIRLMEIQGKLLRAHEAEIQLKSECSNDLLNGWNGLDLTYAQNKLNRLTVYKKELQKAEKFWKTIADLDAKYDITDKPTQKEVFDELKQCLEKGYLPDDSLRKKLLAHMQLVKDEPWFNTLKVEVENEIKKKNNILLEILRKNIQDHKTRNEKLFLEGAFILPLPSVDWSFRDMKILSDSNKYLNQLIGAPQILSKELKDEASKRYRELIKEQSVNEQQIREIKNKINSGSNIEISVLGRELLRREFFKIELDSEKTWIRDSMSINTIS